MSPQTLLRLQRSITDLGDKIGVIAPTVVNLPAVDPKAVFCQNLRQLRDNLIQIRLAASALQGHLDVQTIGNHLHNYLHQSAFTDNTTGLVHQAGHNVAPAHPFTVGSGHTSVNSFPGNIPLHALAQPVMGNPPNLSIAPNAALDNALLGIITQADNALGQQSPYHHLINDLASVSYILDNNCASFCNINFGFLQPGEVLVRCAQKNNANAFDVLEPGEWWVRIHDMPNCQRA
jgi:hypothetical protein